MEHKNLNIDGIILKGLKNWLNDQIIEMDDDIQKFTELKLMHLREKSHYKKRAYQSTLNEIIFLERKLK